MDSADKRSEILDSIINMDINVNDLKRILMIIGHVNYQIESEYEHHSFFNEEALKSWLEYLYNEPLEMEK